MEVINGYGYSDDLDRMEYLIETVVQMRESFGISLEEAAGRFDRYAQTAMRFVESEMFFHDTAEELACLVYYGANRWGELVARPLALAWAGKTGTARSGTADASAVPMTWEE